MQLHDHMHPEAIAYAHHAHNLHARGKVINRYTYNGAAICHRMDGYYVGENRYDTLAQAKEFAPYYLSDAVEKGVSNG